MTFDSYAGVVSDCLLGDFALSWMQTAFPYHETCQHKECEARMWTDLRSLSSQNIYVSIVTDKDPWEGNVSHNLCYVLPDSDLSSCNAGAWATTALSPKLVSELFVCKYVCFVISSPNSTLYTVVNLTIICTVAMAASHVLSVSRHNVGQTGEAETEHTHVTSFASSFDVIFASNEQSGSPCCSDCLQVSYSYSNSLF